MNSLAVALAVFGAAASASSLSAGSAKVVNQCPYDVYLYNVPASGGGYSEQDQTLSSGESWSQTWTQLSNGEGWSIKLSNSTDLASILQYEYTFHNDGVIWFDLSCVNGDPWPANWELTADNGCDPKQTAYRFPTDDDYGMQSCDQDASVQLLLCPSSDSGSAPSSVASAPAYTQATSSVYSAPAPVYTPPSSSAQAPVHTSTSSPAAQSSHVSTTAAAAPSHTGGWGWFSNSNGEVVAVEDYVPPMTLVTSTTAVVSKAPDGADVTVVDVVTAVETAVVTAFARDAPEAPGRHRRHEHMHHAHQH